MGYSARRGFTSGNMKATGAQRQAAVQQQIAQMQEAMNAAQTEVENRSFTASVGGGAVEAVDPEDVEMLQDLVVSAVNEALRQAGDAMDKAMDSITGGLNLGNLGI